MVTIIAGGPLREGSIEVSKSLEAYAEISANGVGCWRFEGDSIFSRELPCLSWPGRGLSRLQMLRLLYVLRLHVQGLCLVLLFHLLLLLRAVTTLLCLLMLLILLLLELLVFLVLLVDQLLLLRLVLFVEIRIARVRRRYRMRLKVAGVYRGSSLRRRVSAGMRAACIVAARSIGRSVVRCTRLPGGDDVMPAELAWLGRCGDRRSALIL